MIGYQSVGCGASKVVMLHDWLGDRTTYDPILPYLDEARFTWVFPDLRGYGLSRHLEGFSLDQAVSDLTELVDHLDFGTFAVAGHSMSGMVALKLAIALRERVTAVVLAAPVTAGGLDLDDGTRAFFEGVAVDQSACRGIVAAVTGNRYGDVWLDHKARRSRETATDAARTGYLKNMLLGGGFTDELAGYATPTLVVTGAHDADGFREADVRDKLGPAAVGSRFETIHEAGHYPMQETPVRYAALLHDFLS
ncbi:pimeloyl-ACP methyl ester carboxylesterase [Azospirillum baldaniorum]|uniref:alpha/beta fold hydrolase n=1 Tax=Azospirillum baldaniorum TaxID=1064539 RepID=UPI0011A841CB|nr:alpha/beta hydrolase [Azospirillum baldaniorum]TWA53850.1 pimeloyl-ACP methyl ester carboxylesterase [Azospirillum baldaniorum]